MIKSYKSSSSSTGLHRQVQISTELCFFCLSSVQLVFRLLWIQLYGKRRRSSRTVTAEKKIQFSGRKAPTSAIVRAELMFITRLERLRCHDLKFFSSEVHPHLMCTRWNVLAAVMVFATRLKGGRSPSSSPSSLSPSLFHSIASNTEKINQVPWVHWREGK